MAIGLLNKPTDYTKFRDMYLSNLQTDINNINRTFNAVQAKNTGNSVPEAPPDMRTVEDKLNDIERLKVQLRSNLLTLTDGENADQIITQLQRQSGGDVNYAFAVSLFPELERILKPNGALGIPAPAFMATFIRLKKRYLETNGVDFGIQQQIGQDMLSKVIGKEDLNRFKNAVLRSNTTLKNTLLATIKKASDNLPTEEELARQREEDDEYEDEVELPLKEDFQRDVANFEDAERRNAVQRQDEIAEKIMEDLTSTKSPQLKSRSGLVRPAPVTAEKKKGSKTKGIPFAANQRYIPEEKEEMEAKGLIRGKGLAVAKKMPPKVEGKVEKPASYVPFGRFVINKHKLNDGVLMLRTPRGGAISKLPTERISENLSKIVSTISKGNIPSFEDMSGLGESEKRHIHNIVNHSHISHISVPKPDLSKDEQDLHRFQVLKGECIAGNSSQAVVKELKHLIVRLLSAGKLPKRQASECLVELASLGL